MLEAIKKYKESHPEVDEIMKKFQTAKEVYEKASASIAPKIRQIYSTSTSDKGQYGPGTLRSISKKRGLF